MARKAVSHIGQLAATSLLLECTHAYSNHDKYLIIMFRRFGAEVSSCRPQAGRLELQPHGMLLQGATGRCGPARAATACGPQVLYNRRVAAANGEGTLASSQAN